MLKIGIIKEGKRPVDRRVAITPQQAQAIVAQFPSVDIVCQQSAIRCFDDDDYADAGIQLVAQVTDCDLLLGVKEVPIHELIADKTYLFFSHTIKKQAYNRALLKALLDKRIKMIDYEALTNASGARVIAFGRYAGIVGAYNAVWAFGEKHNLFHLRRVHECFDVADMQTEYAKIQLSPIKLVITGGGRVAKGAMEVLCDIGIRQVTPTDLVNKDFDEPVFAQLRSGDYHRHKDGRDFDRSEFYDHPADFESDFYQYAKSADILIACAFWSPQAPVLFTAEEAKRQDFKLNIIADITCDIQGSIPSTLHSTTIASPIFDYDPIQGLEMPPFSNESNITVMAVDNLPCELPRNASEDFGQELIENVLPHLIGDDVDQIMARATVTADGELTSHYQYLQPFVNSEE